MKRVRTKSENGDTSHSQEDAATEPEEKPHVTSNFGVAYCPAGSEDEKRQYVVKMQPHFSAEKFGQKQLLRSLQCKVFSRLDDLFFSRNKLRAQLVEEGGLEHRLDDTDLFCSFESQVTFQALMEVVATRPADYRVEEAEPVMEFHTHISLINNRGNLLSIEVTMEDGKKLKEGEKPKKGGFSDRFVSTFKSFLQKLVKHFPT